jgi:hydroxyacylglutathione hydrolase
MTATTWFTIRALDARTWAIDDHGGSLIYLLAGEEKALLLDTGWGVGDLATLVASLTNLPLLVMNTHGHPDHTFGNGGFPQVYIADADRAYVSDLIPDQTRRWIVDNHILPGPLPPDFVFETWATGLSPAFKSLADGQVFELGGRSLQVIALPGHSPGSVSLLEPSARSLYTGDSLLPGVVWLHLDESCPLSEYLAGLERLQVLADRFDRLWPAHGSLGDLPQPVNLLEHMIAGVRAVLDGRLVGQPETTFAGDGLRCDFGPCALLYRPDRF